MSLLNWLFNCKDVKPSEECRGLAHHDYAIQPLLPMEYCGMQGWVCPKCEKMSSIPLGTCWTGSKFFCPYCGYTIDIKVAEIRDKPGIIRVEDEVFYVTTG